MARATREIWADRIRRWRQSGLTAARYAERTGLNANTLRHWNWLLGKTGRRRRAAASAQRTQAPTFVEIFAGMTPPTPSENDAHRAEPFELVLREGVRLRIATSFDAAALRRLLDVVGGR
jgi:transposase